MPLAVIVHGGAGNIPPQRHETARAGCAAAAAIAWRILRANGSALDAVIAAVVALEDNPAFNAGTGAVLTREGVAELDAGLMTGGDLQVGAVAILRRIKNPILLARQVLTSSQVLLVAEGAEAFAVQQGIALCDPASLITPMRHEQWLANRASETPDEPEDHGTVGAVALDAAGHIAAACSTGGVFAKPAGRVGDSPIAGAGFYAEDGVGGVSCTGKGEDFIRLAVARRTVEMMEHRLSAQAAADAVVALLGQRIAGQGGVIVIDATGHVGFARNTAAMAVGYITEEMTAPATSI